ncbi:23S rRNA pseudouridine(1911/1915/1917) synthase RluD [Aliikangiella coralliicola]|uniref:Pseudouridine synthase n=1 Tax=Aliikangiella coralliicola TaxID=2592383 RepID=A0A545U0L5_9GAMM|nr:23S rRNA pseudouridine(1911/1915/1917) synthase RluD [Aliikangiella coralliicola]
MHVDKIHAGERLDRVLAVYFPELSRSRLQAWIKNQQVKVNDEIVIKPKHKILGDELLEVVTTLEDQGEWQASDIPITIHYQDEAIIIVNKPAGLVVHPAPGHYTDTLVNGLLYLFPELRKLPRAGVVHRLDKDTTGLLVVARTAEAHNHLVSELQDRAFKREYLALVHGEIVAGDTIDYPIGRHAVNRKKMAVNAQGKEAITHFRIGEKFNDFTLVQVKLETGRTHQIRVHFSHLKHPLVGDPVYCIRNLKPKGMSEKFEQVLAGFQRQALHARTLGLTHPVSGEWMEWECEVPADIELLLEAIRQHDKLHEKH